MNLRGPKPQRFSGSKHAFLVQQECCSRCGTAADLLKQPGAAQAIRGYCSLFGLRSSLCLPGCTCMQFCCLVDRLRTSASAIGSSFVFCPFCVATFEESPSWRQLHQSCNFAVKAQFFVTFGCAGQRNVASSRRASSFPARSR